MDLYHLRICVDYRPLFPLGVGVALLAGAGLWRVVQRAGHQGADRHGTTRRACSALSSAFRAVIAA